VAASTAAAPHTHPAPGTSGPVAHHFNNMGQQHASVRFGMWLFLVTEVLFFGGAFCAYTVYRLWFPKDFEAGSAVLNVGIASVNTFLLLTSSLTITLAIRACYEGSRKKLMRYLVLTTLLGAAFLGLKAREYQLDYVEGLVPGNASYLTKDAGKEYAEAREADPTLPIIPESAFNENLKVALHHVDYKVKENGVLRPAVAGQDYDPYRVQLFFMFYYSMTGLHVLHMVIGLGILVWQIILTATGFFDHTARYVYIETMSLYWHFVDMVWMFLLPLLYLAGPHNWGQAVEQFGQALGVGGGH
jgi:cytochrome c oxidase subunit 3